MVHPDDSTPAPVPSAPDSAASSTTDASSTSAGLPLTPITPSLTTTVPAPTQQKTALSDISPTAEPISWSFIAASLVDIALAHGFHPDTVEKQLILYILPFLLAGIWARFQVYAPDTVAYMKQLILFYQHKDTPGS